MDFHSNFIHAISSCIVLLEWQMYSLSFFLDIAIEEFQRFLLSIKLQMISWPPPLFCIVCQPWGILFLLYLFSSEMSTHNIQFWVGGKRLEYTCLAPCCRLGDGHRSLQGHSWSLSWFVQLSVSYSISGKYFSLLECNFSYPDYSKDTKTNKQK